MHQPFHPNMLAEFNDRKPQYVVNMYTSYFPAISFRVRKLNGQTAEVVDLTSEIFTRILRRKIVFDTIENLENYLWKTTNTVCKEARLKKERADGKARQVFDFYHLLEERAEENERKRNICRYLMQVAIEVLPSQVKQVFLLSYMEGLSNPEIADRLLISKRTVEYHKNVAYKKLRIALEKKGITGSRLLIGLLALSLLKEWMENANA